MRVDPGFCAQNNPFTDCQLNATSNQVVRQFNHGSGSQVPGVDQRVAEGVEERLYFLVGCSRTRCQHLNASVRNSLFPDNERCVHDSRATQPKLRVNAPYKIWVAAGKINIETAVMHSVQKAVWAKGHGFHLWRSR